MKIKIDELSKGDFVTIIHTQHGAKRISQGYVRYVDARYIVLGMGFMDDWVNIEKINVNEITNRVSL